MREYIRQGYRSAVDMDLSKFLDRVNHDVLMHRVARKIRDKHILRLIGKYLRAGVVIKGRSQETREGLPQGGPLSPLLSNILLDELDQELGKRGHRFVRYADQTGGKLINLLMHVHSGDAFAVVDGLKRPGIPQRLKGYAAFLPGGLQEGEI